MDKASCKAVRKDLDAAMAKVLKKHGLEGKLNNLAFGENGITVKKFEITRIMNAAESKDAIRANFDKHCRVYGFKKSDFGTEVQIGTTTAVFEGFNLSRHKNSISIRDKDGHRYMTTVTAMKRALSRAAS